MGMFGRKIGNFAGKVDRFAGRVAGEMSAPTTGIGQLGRAIRMGFDDDYQQAELQREALGLRQAQAQAEQEAAYAKAMAPEYRSAGGDIVRVDPATGEAQVVYQAAEQEPSFVREMRAMGIEPQSPEARDMYARRSAGYQYTPEGIAATGKIARAKAAARPAAAKPMKPPPGFILD